MKLDKNEFFTAKTTGFRNPLLLTRVSVRHCANPFYSAPFRLVKNEDKNR